MSTRDRILDVAEIAFAERGFVGASFRHITSRAEVNLAAVHYHFGSKAALYEPVLERGLAPLFAERIRRLDATEVDGEVLCSDKILGAWLGPSWELLLHHEHGPRWVKILWWSRLESPTLWRGFRERNVFVVERFVAALDHALPLISRSEVARRFHFFLGVEMNTIVDVETLSFIDKGVRSVYEDPERVAAELIQFASAGFLAPPLAGCKQVENVLGTSCS